MDLTADDIKYQLANLRQLTFEVTDACNLKCKYCAYGEFYNDYDERHSEKLSVTLARRIIDYLSEFWESQYNMSDRSHVYISFYGGEPLMNMPFIRSIIEYIETSGITNRQFTFSMTTNGILLEKNIDYLAEKRVELLVSLDGDELGSSYRVYSDGKASYDDVIRNIDIVRQRYPQYFEDKVHFNSVLHNRNSTAGTYRFIKNKYNKIPAISELNNMGIRQDKREEFMQTYRNSRESLRQAENYELIEQDMFMRSATYQTLASFLHRNSGFVYHDYTDLLFGMREKRFPTGTCIPFSRKMFVTVNGKILPCERIGQQFVLGYASESEISIDFEAIAQQYNVYFATLEKQCSKCYNKEGCIQCIFNLNNLDVNPKCHGFMDHSQFLVHQNSQMDFLRNSPEDYYRIMEDVFIE